MTVNRKEADDFTVRMLQENRLRFPGGRWQICLAFKTQAEREKFKAAILAHPDLTIEQFIVEAVNFYIDNTKKKPHKAADA